MTSEGGDGSRSASHSRSPIGIDAAYKGASLPASLSDQSTTEDGVLPLTARDYGRHEPGARRPSLPATAAFTVASTWAASSDQGPPKHGRALPGS